MASLRNLKTFLTLRIAQVYTEKKMCGLFSTRLMYFLVAEFK